MQAFRARVRLVVEIAAVLAPLPATMLLAAATGIERLSLAGVPCAVLVAWWTIRRRKSRWTDMGLRRPKSWLKIVAIAVLATPALMVGTTVCGSLLARLTGLVPDVAKFDILRGNLSVLAIGLMIVWTSAAFGEEIGRAHV